MVRAFNCCFSPGATTHCQEVVDHHPSLRKMAISLLGVAPIKVDERYARDQVELMADLYPNPHLGAKLSNQRGCGA